MVGRSGKGINSCSLCSGTGVRNCRRIRSACLCHMFRCAVMYGEIACACEEMCVLHTYNRAHIHHVFNTHHLPCKFLEKGTSVYIRYTIKPSGLQDWKPIGALTLYAQVYAITVSVGL